MGVKTMTEDVIQMKIGKFRSGIIGFKTACSKLAGTHKNMTDEEIKSTLITELKKSNYIPDSARKEYEIAFFAAFKKSVGEPVEEVANTGGLEIKVLGQGCVRCRQLEQDVMAVLAEMKVNADLEHVTEIKEIAAYGVLGLPGLVINGKVISAGSLPPKAKIMDWIHHALENKE
jgi:small redox-active disulfide protein 2